MTLTAIWDDAKELVMASDYEANWRYFVEIKDL
jgi:hypothetical protein